MIPTEVVTHTEYFRNLFDELGVVLIVKTYIYDNEDDGCTYNVVMESWSEKGKRVRDEIVKGECLYNWGTDHRPEYFLLEPC
jgi:hypothetical protein